MSDNAVIARYTFHNQDTAAHTISLRLLNELCPDYAQVVRHGRSALTASESEGYPAVHNPITGATISVRPSHPWHTATIHEALLALEIEQTLDLQLQPNTSYTLSIQLQVQFV